MVQKFGQQLKGGANSSTGHEKSFWSTKNKINKANDEPISSNMFPSNLTTVKCKRCENFQYNSRTCKGKNDGRSTIFQRK